MFHLSDRDASHHLSGALKRTGTWDLHPRVTTKHCGHLTVELSEPDAAHASAPEPHDFAWQERE